MLQVKLATLDEAIYVSRDRQIMFTSTPKVQQRLCCTPSRIINRYRAFLPGGKNGRSVKLITHLHVMLCLKLREYVLLIPHTSSQVFLDLRFNVCVYCQCEQNV